MNEDKKLEYQELRDEISLVNQMISTIANFSIGGSIAVLGFIIPKIVSFGSIMLFWLPLLIVYPSCLLIVSRIQSVRLIAAYIIVFIEPSTDLRFESRAFKLNPYKLRFRKTILWTYLALILFDIILFALSGFFSTFDIICYLISLLLFLLIYRLMSVNWKEKYIIEWEKVKAYEETTKGI